MNGDIVSIDKPTYFVVNPGLDEPSKPPPPLYIRLEDIVDDLGPYSMTMQSQHCMVGGLLLFRLNLPFPPMDLFVYSIRVRIIQSVRLHSPVDKSHIQCPTPSVQTVFVLDATIPPNNGKVSEPARPNKTDPQSTRLGPMKVLRKDEPWKVLHLARIPSDNFVRPSTFAGTITPISISHAIQMEMIYRPATEDEINSPSPNAGEPSTVPSNKGKEAEPERRKITMSKPLEIFSVSASARRINSRTYHATSLTPVSYLCTVLLLPRLAHPAGLFGRRPEPRPLRLGTPDSLRMRSDTPAVSDVQLRRRIITFD